MWYSFSGFETMCCVSAGCPLVKSGREIFMETAEIRSYLEDNGFGVNYLLDAWKENDYIFYISGLPDILGSQTMIEIDPGHHCYRNKSMRAGGIWTEWMQIA